MWRRKRNGIGRSLARSQNTERLLLLQARLKQSAALNRPVRLAGEHEGGAGAEVSAPAGRADAHIHLFEGGFQLGSGAVLQDEGKAFDLHAKELGIEAALVRRYPEACGASIFQRLNPSTIKQPGDRREREGS